MPTKQPRPSFALGQKSYDSVLALAKRDGKNLSEWLRDLVEREVERANMPVETLPQQGEALQEYNAQRRLDAILRNASVHFSAIELHAMEHGVTAWIASDELEGVFVVKFGNGGYIVYSPYGVFASDVAGAEEEIHDFLYSEYLDSFELADPPPVEDKSLFELVPHEWRVK